MEKRVPLVIASAFLVLVSTSLLTCSRSSEEKVLVHYFPFARHPYAPVQLTSPDSVSGTFSFSVDRHNSRIERVIRCLDKAGSGTFDGQDVRLVIRFNNGDVSAVDAKGGVLNKGTQGRLTEEHIKELALAVETMPENPYSRVIGN